MRQAYPFLIPLRLDLYLKASRLVPRRSVAQELCDAGKVEVNGHAAKPSKEVKIGDQIAINRRNRLLEVSVLHLPATKQVSKAGASELYQVVRDEVRGEDLFER